MTLSDQEGGYRYLDHATNNSHSYLLPSVLKELEAVKLSLDSTKNELRVFDLGCGNGSVGSIIHSQGWGVIGVDPSKEGIEQATKNHPNISLYEGSAYDDLSGKYGRFPVVISLEVVEHIYSPRVYAKTLYDLLVPGGTAIVSTPYHGYLKNLMLALTGKLDKHFTALWDHGHIKFWSISTLKVLLLDAGFSSVRFVRVGRVPPLAKSMIAIARRS